MMTNELSDNSSPWSSFTTAGPAGKISLVLSTWFFSGLMPLAPGTFGTIGSVPFILALNYLDVYLRAPFLVIFIVVAIWSSGKSEEILGRKDPPEIVIDEVAGFSVTMCFLPSTLVGIIAGFILFRLMDIFKPFPIKRLEKGLAGGYGIVADDLMAGFYAFAGTKALLWLL